MDIKKYSSIYKFAIPLDIELFYNNSSYNKYRRFSIIILSNLLNQIEKFRIKKYKEQNEFLKLIEMGCYDKTIKDTFEDNISQNWDNIIFLNYYNTNCYELFNHLNEKKNIKLINLIFDEKFDLKKLGLYEDEFFNYDLYLPIKKEIEKRLNVKLSKKSSKIYKCPKCKKFKVNVNYVQKRALDENASEEILCLNCNYFWINM